VEGLESGQEEKHKDGVHQKQQLQTQLYRGDYPAGTEGGDL
jgi:hypothetical protein